MSINHPSFGKLDDARIIIFDTTLRDGEQSPGFSMNLAEKLRMAEALAELGVDVIEAGFPIASPGDFESVADHRRTVKGPVICGLARTGRGDVMRAGEAVAPAERKRIHTFIATSALHMKYKLRMEPRSGARRRPPTASPWPASIPTTSSGRPRTAAAPTPTSCAAASRPPSPPAPPPSTSPTPSATPCPRTWRASSPCCASACRGPSG